MKVIDPKPITLVSSNVPEDDAPLWSDTATYALGAQVIRPNHRLYEALRAVAAGETPETHTAGDNPAWSDKGSTNRHRMFDVYASRQTTHNGPMLVELDASKCNSIALWNIQGATLALTLTSGGQTVWSLPPQSLLLPSGNSYFSWFFGERDYRRNHYVQFPLYVSATLGIEIGGTATACGEVVPGQVRYLGETVDKPEDQALDHSVIEADEWGGYDLIPGTQTSRWTYNVQVERPRAAAVKRQLAKLAARPTTWLHHNDRGVNLPDLMSYGFVSSRRRVFENATMTTFEIEITELP